MRIGIVALLHESNTFVSDVTDISKFQQDMLLRGEEVRDRLTGAPHEVGGFFAGLNEENLQAVPILAARALPYGPIDAPTREKLLAMLAEELDRAEQDGPLDGILAAPHGATVAVDQPDADGDWLTRLRQRIGSHVPLIATIDPHANLSPAMVKACDAIIAYRTNPHLDQHDRGREAARLMARTLRGQIKPVQAACFPPMAINIEKQHTAEPPCAPLYAAADAMLQTPGVLSNSIVLGFPYADVPEMGSATLVVTDNDQALAQRLADELGRQMWEQREAFAGSFISMDDAVDRAAALNGPVCLLDMGDNVGGGSTADGTHLAHVLNRKNVGPSFICICDPQAAREAQAAGAGAQVALTIAGRTPGMGEPLTGTFTVLSLHDGRYEETQVRHGGFTHNDQGTTAIVRHEALTIMLTSRRALPFSLKQITAFGIDPAAYHVLVAKGVNAPLAAYAPLCRHFIRVNTPGPTCADMRQLPYHHRRRPMFPFETDTVWKSL